MTCLSWLASLELRGAKLILAGPPCSGKTTFAARHALAGDVVLDYDVIHAELTGLPLYVHDESAISQTTQLMGTRAAALRQGWILGTMPSSDARCRARELHNARSIVLEVWPGELERRLQESERPGEAKARLGPVIRQWWQRYEADHEARVATWLGVPHETVLREAELLEASR